MFTISSGFPKRPVGFRARRIRLASSSLTSQSIRSGVSTGPGQIALVRMPFGPNWTARLLVRLSTAPFEAVYASWGTEQPTSATKLAMLMIDPPPAISIAGMAYLQPRNTPRTLTAITWSQTSTDVSVTEWSASGMTPALLYRTSSRPYVPTAWSTISFASASFDTSAFTNVACPPAAVIWSTVSRPAASPNSATTTFAPCSANIRAATRPIPPPPPVMIETLSASRILAGPPSRAHRTRGPGAGVGSVDGQRLGHDGGGRRWRYRPCDGVSGGGSVARQRPRRGRRIRRPA